MLAAAEAGEVFLLLEGAGDEGTLHALYSSVREPWLARGLLHYHARTGSARALDLLARAPDNHARHALDALADLLRAPTRSTRRAAAAAAARLVARRPPWLHRLPAHPALPALLRLLRADDDPPALLDALLALVALVAAAPALVPAHWPDLGEAFARLAAWDPPAPDASRDHLQLGLYALFHALYATHPCTLMEFLRAEYGRGGGGEVFRLTVRPMLESVRLHPALVTGSRQAEAAPGRWARSEHHDVLAECRRFALEAREREARTPRPGARSPPARDPPPEGSGARASLRAGSLRPGAEPWFCLSERCGAGSAPHTPLPATDAPGGSPPEAAVEATPENTPVKEPRTQFQFPAESGCVRAIGRGSGSQPPSPLRKETSPSGGAGEGYGGRLARVVLERAGAEAGSPRRSRGGVPESPVPIGSGAPPSGAEWPIARPSPGRPEALDPEPLNVEDREVLELTTRGAPGSAPGPGWGSGGLRMPRGSAVLAAARGVASRLRLYSGRTGPWGRAGGSCLTRARSCPSLAEPAPRRRSVAAQTVDAWPAPYEFLLSEFYQNISEKPNEQSEAEPAAPSERLDAYLARLYEGGVGVGSSGELAEQLALTHAQLMYERWRREAHAERNRRLLGRCRQARALEQENAALRDRVRALQRDDDDLRERLQALRGARHREGEGRETERAARLEAELAAEVAARERAEAALEEAETRRADEVADVQRLRAESFELARRLEGASRAARLAERRADAVRGLRRELLILGEREARLAEAASAAGAGAAEAAATSRLLRQYRDEAAALRAEVAAASARAEALAARDADLEAALAAREAQAAELRREGRAGAERSAARLASVQDKYRALMHVVRRMETRRLEVLAGGFGAGGAPSASSPQSSPLSASLASAEGALATRPALSDVSRCRHLLDDEPPALTPTDPAPTPR